LSPEDVRRGGPPGFRPAHLVIGAVVLVLWFGGLAFVLAHGRDETSSADVYSQLPPGFTSALEAEGVTYSGLSPVDSGTEDRVLAQLPADSSGSGGTPLVFRTSYSVTTGSGQSRTSTPALMVVIPSPTDNGFRVDFVDPVGYRVLDSVEYGAPSDVGGSTTP
jgi:hypothetical protein